MRAPVWTGWPWPAADSSTDRKAAKWYILSSADHNIVQINEINSEGKAGDKVGELSKLVLPTKL